MIWLAHFARRQIEWSQVQRMTALLEQAFEVAKRLPPTEQDAIAARLLAELASEDEFDAKIAATANRLARLSEDALREYRAGETLPLDPDEL
jgi:hypothetical protein